MEDETWIKIYRKILKSPIWDNEKALKIWVWCLIKATYDDRQQLVGKTIVELKPGEFIFGRNKASAELKMKPTTVYEYMYLLKNLKMIDIKSNNKFSVVSIEKYELYQSDNRKSDNKATTKRQQSDTNKNIKNINKYIGEFTNNENLLNAFMDFINYRKKIKKEITDEGIKRIITKFKNWEYTEEECIACLEQSMERSWTGIFELKNRKPKQQNIEEYKAIDDSQLTREEQIQFFKGEKTMEDFLKEGKVKYV